MEESAFVLDSHEWGQIKLVRFDPVCALTSKQVRQLDHQRRREVCIIRALVSIRTRTQ